MSPNAKAQLIATLLTAGLFVWACRPAAAAVRIEGQVQAGGGPVASSTVTLWAANAGQPQQLAQATTDADGRFTLNSDATPGSDVSLYVIATARPPSTKLAATIQPSLC
jgi:hypothetical protein